MNERPKRSLLIIGATFADARAFLGYDTNAAEIGAAPRREERRSSAVPDALWPTGAYLITWFRGADVTNENGSGPPYDAVIVTADALALRTGEDYAALVKPGGWLWVEPGAEAR